MLTLILLILAAVCAVLVLIGVEPKVKLLAVGLVAVVAALLIPRF